MVISSPTLNIDLLSPEMFSVVMDLSLKFLWVFVAFRRLSHPSILLLMGTCRINNLEGLVLIYERIGLGSLFCCLYQKVGTHIWIFYVASLEPYQMCTANIVSYGFKKSWLKWKMFFDYIWCRTVQLCNRRLFFPLGSTMGFSFCKFCSAS